MGLVLERRLYERIRISCGTFKGWMTIEKLGDGAVSILFDMPQELVIEREEILWCRSCGKRYRTNLSWCDKCTERICTAPKAVSP